MPKKRKRKKKPNYIYAMFKFLIALSFCLNIFGGYKIIERKAIIRSVGRADSAS